MLSIGIHIGDFVLTEVIAQHGRVVVYRAHQTSVDRDVTIKFINIDPHDSSDSFQRRFLAKIGRRATLEGLHILPVYAYGIHDETWGYVVMRYMRGGTLESWISADRAAHLDWGRVEILFLQIANALAFTHRNGLIHGNFKPSNVLFDEQGNAFVSDFGVSSIGQRADVSPFHDLDDSTLISAIAYLAPEQLRGGLLDERTDVYAVGAVLYAIFTGFPPIQPQSGELVADYAVRLLFQSIVPVQERNPAIPDSINAVVMCALAKDPAARYSSMDALITAFTDAMRRFIGESRSNDPLTDMFNTITMEQPVLRLPVERDEWSKRLFAKPITMNTSAVWLGLSVVLLLLVLVLAAWSYSHSLQQAAEQVSSLGVSPHILTDVEGTVGDTVPTDDEIERARVALSDDFIAYIACGLDSETQAARAREMSDLAREYGLNFRVYDSQMSDYRQSTLIEQARAEGAQGIILCMLSDMNNDTLADVRRARIPLVITSIPAVLVSGVGVGIDSWELGRAAARLAVELRENHPDPNARIALFGIPPIRRNDVMQGMEAELRELLPEGMDFGGVIEGTTRESARESMRELLATGQPPPDVILTFSDSTAYGVIDALEEANISLDAVQIVSINGETIARSYVERAYFMAATISVNREAVSHAAFGAMVRLIAGSEVPQIIEFRWGEIFRRPS